VTGGGDFGSGETTATGTSVTYYSPESNTNCVNKPVITLNCMGKPIQSVSLGIHNPWVGTDYAYNKQVKCGTCWDWYCCCIEQKYSCSGAYLGNVNDYSCANYPSCHGLPPSYPGVGCSDGSSGGPRPGGCMPGMYGLDDKRTSDQILDGCCPQALM